MTDTTDNGRARLGELLVRAGRITRDDLAKALAIQRASGTGERLGATLVAFGLCTEESIAEALSEQLGLPNIAPEDIHADEAAIAAVGDTFCREHEMAPIRTADGYCLVMADPLSGEFVDLVRQVLRSQVRPAVASRSAVLAALEAVGGPTDPLAALVEDADQQLAAGGGGIGKDTGPVARLLAETCSRASEAGATDIHIVPESEEVVVLFRVDGSLRETMRFPYRLLGPLSDHIRVLSGSGDLSLRAPISGRVTFRHGSVSLQFSAFALPTTRGEKIVLRPLSLPRWIGTLDDMGLSREHVGVLRDVVARPQGAVVFAGPTGSGRTTMLYACLGAIGDSSRDVATIEDPVDRDIHGITQVRVDDAAGLTYPAGLRVLVDQEPDVIAVGDLREPETAQAAIRAALAGRLVLTCLHAYDSVAAITRLRDLGVESALIASSVSLVVSMRLVSRLCPHCRSERPPRPVEAAAWGRHGRTEPENVWDSEGCEACSHLGSDGRVAVVEVLPIDGRLATDIAEGAGEPVLRALAQPAGGQWMFEAGLDLAEAGVISMPDLLRTVPMPRSAPAGQLPPPMGPIPRQRVFGTGEVVDRARFEAFCRALPDLPTLPEAVARLELLMEGPKPTLAEVVGIIEPDPVLAARLLRVANSVSVEAPREVTTISQAVLHLGLSQVLGLTIVASAAPALPESGDTPLDFGGLWRHALAVGACARALADGVPGVERERAFLAGLLHDLGKVVLCLSRAREFGDCVRTAAAAGVPLWRVEQDVFSFSHGLVGAWMLQAWGLPTRITTAIEFHHHPHEAPDGTAEDARRLALVVSLANSGAKAAGLDGSGDRTTLPEAAPLLDELGLGSEALESAVQEAQRAAARPIERASSS